MPACCRDKTLGAGTSKARGVLIPSRIGLALGHRIFENSRKNLSGEPFLRIFLFKISAQREGKIPRFRGYTPPDPWDPQSRKPAKDIIPDAHA